MGSSSLKNGFETPASSELVQYQLKQVVNIRCSRGRRENARRTRHRKVVTRDVDVDADSDEHVPHTLRLNRRLTENPGEFSTVDQNVVRGFDGTLEASKSTDRGRDVLADVAATWYARRWVPERVDYREDTPATRSV
jgi:hypothetical protein